ncbi:MULTISPECIES: glycosyltransferase family 4 protein [Maribacter]|uniref:Glycosyltransferase involved in cell wall bisynthesis n=1 Tax=Maribacter dokdonensis TaxID=320912 RepID=A0A1H4QD85_9FLAO|nr:glycosyltransferase family 4 protein [Maribacter dokdonensis]SEC17625.1 Glycosyltransferase involved in cell wall bisynthesis [Maribacter dokdonensis]
MRILVISNNYPSNAAPTYGVFVYNLIQKFVALGHEVNVIACSNIVKGGGNTSAPNYGSENASIHYPKIITASNKWILGYNTHLIGEYFSVRAVKKTVEENRIKFDVVYAHFLVNGIIAVKALHDYGKPIYVAEGELKNINLRKKYYKAVTYHKLISKIKGFVAVSPQIKDNLIEVGIEEEKIIIKPNAVDLTKFNPKDKRRVREKLGLPLDKKLVIFVGRFVHDKGPLRVLKALEDKPGVALMFVGKGEQELTSDKIAFKGKVPTDLVPDYLSAADVFVLPTLHEGSCNAIIEAMACGLPIVSSDIPEIQFQCKPDFSILVDPMDERKIRVAVNTILDNDDKREEMSTNAIAYAKKFEITNRAKDILDFIS